VIVVLSRGTFSVLAEQSYVAVWEGDAIQGDFSTLGTHSFEIVGVMPVEMEVTATGLTLQQASDLFRVHCELKAKGAIHVRHKHPTGSGLS